MSEKPEVRLRGLYDVGRTDELAQSLIPIIAGECDTINMSEVAQIERVALAGFLPLIKELQPGITHRKISVVGMNDDVGRTLQRAGLIRYFRTERSVTE